MGYTHLNDEHVRARFTRVGFKKFSSRYYLSTASRVYLSRYSLPLWFSIDTEYDIIVDGRNTCSETTIYDYCYVRSIRSMHTT